MNQKVMEKFRSEGLVVSEWQKIGENGVYEYYGSTKKVVRREAKILCFCLIAVLTALSAGFYGIGTAGDNILLTLGWAVLGVIIISATIRQAITLHSAFNERVVVSNDGLFLGYS